MSSYFVKSQGHLKYRKSKRNTAQQGGRNSTPGSVDFVTILGGRLPSLDALSLHPGALKQGKTLIWYFPYVRFGHQDKCPNEEFDWCDVRREFLRSSSIFVILYFLWKVLYFILHVCLKCDSNPHSWAVRVREPDNISGSNTVKGSVVWYSSLSILQSRIKVCWHKYVKYYPGSVHVKCTNMLKREKIPRRGVGCQHWQAYDGGGCGRCP